MDTFITLFIVVYFLCNLGVLLLIGPKTARGIVTCVMYGVLIAIAVAAGEDDDDGED